MESVQPNFESDLPTYFPLHLSLRVNTEFSAHQLLNQIDDRLVILRKNTDGFLTYLSENSHLLQDNRCNNYLSNQLQALKKLLLSKYRLQALQSLLKAAHREFVESRRQELDLSLDNYYIYKDVTKQNFADKIVDELAQEDDTSYESLLKGDSMYQFFKNALFVVENPEDPLPDEQNDDEVAVAGGKISLKDPLSLNYFVEPVSSRKCHHIYEKKHIMRQFQDNLPINCPVIGCTAKLQAADLLDDKLMALRVKVFLSRTKKQSLVRV
ncbi:CIC11C00000002898 [Sungouiella intermedia]|uniref:CIC11C00000002898 n=1 Tax=Sungouiella intermedia TaxID=45354 RepID=A0A1L0D7W1_9ASCO|nr:CIC11C00000002898 [[Candida] intermedia]